MTAAEKAEILRDLYAVRAKINRHSELSPDVRFAVAEAIATLALEEPAPELILEPARLGPEGFHQ